jgi:hypothetical protein
MAIITSLLACTFYRCRGGRIAAGVIDNTLLHNAHFMSGFERAKSEVLAALGLSAVSNQ